ncbi:cytochrome b/b6 domain-containing protein [Polynucleobacter sp. MWH-UH35A]|uniref:cytochrome b/b6 domain-containing protein n=1 Tax=Polynucleobacter sp. MWH-UH35A TaxID=1855619 RepID=UPI001BFE0675|nr:cytochrome b/b6 domain-containing protein [Polynucleobacter sp. MWH-UH35A]QWD59785.1 cytochrome b/b6 domain-containing protein [Polynucleobacter sp. MWH-UH35A]
MTNKQTILVWDMPTRVFHWLLVISFAGAWFTSESERLQMIHYAFGYSAVALVLFRLVWGFIGTKYARFSQFVRGPKEMVEHAKGLLSGHQHVSPGHNPVGGIVMVGLMLLILLIGLTGYWGVKEFLGDFMSEAHEAVASLTLGLVIIHIAAAVIMSLLQKENLVQAMLNGKKQGLPEQSIKFPQYLIGGMLALGCLYFFYLVVSGSLPALTQ